MNIAIDISLYPLHEDYEQPIIAFVQQLRKTSGLQVHTNQLTTQISGEYTLVMDTLRDAMGSTFQSGGKYSFVLKVVNVDIEPGTAVLIE